MNCKVSFDYSSEGISIEQGHFQNHLKMTFSELKKKRFEAVKCQSQNSLFCIIDQLVSFMIVL